MVCRHYLAGGCYLYVSLLVTMVEILHGINESDWRHNVLKL